MRIMLFAAGGDYGGGKPISYLGTELSENNDSGWELSQRRFSREGRKWAWTVVIENGWNVFNDMRMALREVDSFAR